MLYKMAGNSSCVVTETFAGQCLSITSDTEILLYESNRNCRTQRFPA